jgi:CspA family cold shock protein
MNASGLVRWFDTTKGYGFVVAEDGKGDVLVHVKVLRAVGVSFVAEGWWIQARVEDTPRGRKAVEVLDVRPPGPERPVPEAGPLEPARVKWFNRNKGFGFVNVFGRPLDVFLHMSTLRAYGFEAPADGIALAVRVAPGRDREGPTVCEVRSWDYVLRPRGRRRPSHGDMDRGRLGQPALDAEALRALAAAIEMLRLDVRGGRRGRRAATPPAGCRKMPAASHWVVGPA